MFCNPTVIACVSPVDGVPVIPPVTVKEPDMFKDPVILCLSVMALPIVVPVPVTVNSVVLPLTTENCVRETLAVTLPVAICDKLSPDIAEAGIEFRFAPDPENEPEIP